MSLQSFNPTDLERSQKLTQLIRQAISISGGALDFAQFMEMALYTPDLGYYAGTQRQFGAQGDFITAPHITPLFAKTVARQCQQILTSMPSGDILEIGAGSGLFAKDLLLELEKLNALPTHYYILDISAALRLKQQQLLKESIPHLFNRIHWLNELPREPINGVIFANEVLDALPVRLFRIDESSIKERCVGWDNNQFTWHLIPAAEEIKKILTFEIDSFSLPYESEVNIALPLWMQSIVSTLNSGIILLFDYGYGRAEYYHPDRSMGTLMCYSQHTKQANPLAFVGLQDISAHVDFTHVIESVDLKKCSLAGFTTQANFLLSCGLLSIAEQENETDSFQHYKKAQAIKKLIMPGEMGELIKVIALQKEFTQPLLGFSLNDRRCDL